MPSSFGTNYEKIQSTTAAFTYNSGAPTATSGAPDLLLVDTTAGNITVTLPSALGNYSLASNGLGPFRIVNIGATGYAVDVVAAGGTVYGNARLLGQYSEQVYTSDGVTGWFGATLIGSSTEVRVALSSAQILALNATPVTLVPAPGLLKVVIAESIALQMTTTATQYANGGALEFRYTNASGAKVSADIAAAVVTTTAGVSYTSVAGVTTSLTNVVNSPITISNATAPFITGTGTGVINVKFRVVTFS